MAADEGEHAPESTSRVHGPGRRSRAPRDLVALAIRTTRRARVLQDRLLLLLGSASDQRPAVVATMLARSPHESASYWLQLVVSIGIATLGLVVGSAAVIIGAMLVAPLMGPIIALAMGLAAGSPFLALRSAARIALSVVTAIAGAAVITLLLPFHELNAEIAARTAPTVLDLLTAGFCALAGVYASLRPGSETAATAAGTSIGISLVPPLCASGYGVGTAAWNVAGGAALLFITNLAAIIVVGTLSFVAAGFNRVDATVLEREELAKNQGAAITAAVARSLAGLFESKAGPALRFLMPLLLLAAVYVPLRQALDEVAWQVLGRAAVEKALDRHRERIVQSRARVERHEIDLLLVLLGTTADAEAARAQLSAELQAAAGVTPRVEVHAIPDARAFAGLESTLRTQNAPLPLPSLPPAPQTPAEKLDPALELLRVQIGRLWPRETAGNPLAVRFGAEEGGPLRVEVVHLGPPLSADAAESLARSLGSALARDVAVTGHAIPAELLTRSSGDLSFVERVTAGLRNGAAVADLSVCVVQPSEPRGRRSRDTLDPELTELLINALDGHPRVSKQTGDAWSVHFVRGPCADGLPPASTESAGPPTTR